MPYPAIDVLLAAFNGAAFIQAQIQSILDQDYNGMIRIIIRDDGSTDNTVALIQAIQQTALPNQRHIHLLERTSGQGSVSTNFAALIEAATADYMALADQDDVWMPYKLRIQMDQLLDAEKQYGAATPLLVCSDLTVVDAQLQPLHHSFWQLQKLDPAWAKSSADLLVQNVVTGCTTLFNRAAKSVILPIPTENGVFHDHWMAAAVAHHGYVIPLHEQTVLYRQHGNNVEAAHAFDGGYQRQKLAQLGRIIQRSQSIAKALQQPKGRTALVWHKLRLNLKRLFL